MHERVYTDKTDFIFLAFDRHIRDGHCADFEVCPDRICKVAATLESNDNLDITVVDKDLQLFLFEEAHSGQADR